MMMLKMMAGLMIRLTVRRRITLMLATTAVVLSACSAGDAPLELPEDYVPEPEIDAATIDPCASQFVFQREVNGVPDDTAIEKSSSEGKSLITQRYWYANTSMIVSFMYADGEAWCNVWNESPASWNR